MKHNTMPCRPIRQPLYPNAADTRYFTEKALEILGAILSGTGAISIMVFFITMS